MKHNFFVDVCEMVGEPRWCAQCWYAEGDDEIEVLCGYGDTRANATADLSRRLKLCVDAYEFRAAKQRKAAKAGAVR